MKRFSAIIVAVLFTFPLSCYIINTEKGTSRVMLAQSFPAGVTALHVAVFQGTSAEENLLAYQVFYPGQSVNLNVPGGSARVFAVWGEGTSGTATYYGTAGPVDVASDGEMEVPVSMVAFKPNPNVFNLNYTNPWFRWNNVVGATAYDLQINNTFYQQYTIYFGPNTSFYSVTGATFGGMRMRAYSSIFNLYSDWNL
jgi:hypothetical protein